MAFRRLMVNVAQMAAVIITGVALYILLPIGWFLLVLGPALFLIAAQFDPDRTPEVEGVRRETIARAIRWAKFHDEPAPGRGE